MKHATTVERPRRKGPARQLWTLRPLFGAGEVRRDGPRLLKSGRLVLGRGPERGWELPEDPLLSREHLALELRGQKLFARDLESRNGSSVDGQPLRGERELRGGELLRLGDSFLLVRRVPADLRPSPPRGATSGLLGEAPAMHRLRRELSRMGPRAGTVMLLGESGTGKGVSAQALHALSGRRGPLVSVNCAAIPAQLAESTLFGHQRGAFTGADSAHEGFFRRSSGGTLFLDEIADLPLELQPKLLHALEAGEVTPVGSARPVPVDLRVVTATSLDLEQAVGEGRFRGELHARLAELVLRLPPLRERREDLLPLLDRDLPAPLGPDLVERLLLHDWPWNVRELEKVAAELRLRGEGMLELGVELVEDRLPRARVARGEGPPEGEAVIEALRRAGGRVTAAAELLGRSRRQLYRDLERLGIDPADYRGA